MPFDPLAESVTLTDPSSDWAERYAAQASTIASALGEVSSCIEHIGSTSVPIRAKPIIDIQVVVPAVDVVFAITRLKQHGFEHHGQAGVPGREYLTKRDTPDTATNVHVFADDSPLPEDNRLIRDYLRAHPPAAAQYAYVKDRALEQGHVDLLSYSHAKGAHVAAIREAAYAWSRGPISSE